MSLTIVRDVEQLQKYCRVLGRDSWIGVDTEFLRVRTYYPRLCLIQVSSTNNVVGVDPLECKNLDPLIELLNSNEQIKVIHAARQDLEVLYHICGGVPQPVFDTQIAAALLGYADQTSYAALVADIVGEKVAKEQTRTNWCARPLTDDQLAYAYEDVCYLGHLYRRFRNELETRGRLSWIEEECKRLVDVDLYRQPPEQAYRRLRRRYSLNLLSQHVLKRLAAWREHTAQTRDLPRNWVADDRQLVELAAAQPRTHTELEAIPNLPSRFSERYGDEIVAVVTRAQCAREQRAIWTTPTRLTDEQKQRANQLLDIMRREAEKLDIAATLLATRRDVEGLVRGRRDLPLLNGWRLEAVGRKLLQELGAE